MDKVCALEKKLRDYENEKEQIVEFGKTEKQLILANVNSLKNKTE